MGIKEPTTSATEATSSDMQIDQESASVSEFRVRIVQGDVSMIPKECLQVQSTSGMSLESLSLALLRPCVTRKLWAVPAVRALLPDLTARWLLLLETGTKDVKRCPFHDNHGHGLAALDPSPKHDRDGNLIAAAQANPVSQEDLLELFLIAFSTLIPLAPQIFAFSTAIFENIKLSPITLLINSLQQYPTEHASHLNVVRALYNLTRTQHISTFTNLWDFGPLFEFLTANYKVVEPVFAAYTIHTMFNVLSMTDAERTESLNKYLGHALDSEGQQVLQSDHRIALLRIIEDESIQLDRAELFRAPHPDRETSKVLCEFTAADLTPLLVDIAGVLLPKPNLRSLLPSQNVMPTKKLVWTNTTRKNLNRIAISVSMGAPVLITGPAGCGKTSLIEEVSRMVGQKDLLKIHLGDQTDSKILLGTYVCQSEPGSFKWQPGILTTAVMNGRWVLIEDLDLAPMEVISVLIPLLETGHLFIPSRGEKVRAKEGFQLFATQTVAASSSRWGAFAKAGGNEMGASLWNKIAVEPLPSDEMCLVIETLYPSLGAGLGKLIVETFDRLVDLFRSNLGVNRVVSFRDVVKWCRRLERLHIEVLEATSSDGTKLMSGAVHSIDEVSLQAKEALFREAVECFTMMIQDRKMRNKAMAIVADILAVPEARLEFYTEHYLPVLAPSDSAASVSQGKGRKLKQKISVGRVSLSFTPTATTAFATGSTFANTSLSLRLLEKLAVCVSMQESVLLTGETGTGKTTIIQQLANMCGKSLTVINMSQQSDSTDLLGGFKPIEATMIAMPMLERFEMLFSRTFSATSNAAFLESVRGAYIKRKWDVLKQGFGNAVRMADKVLGISKSKDGSEPVAKKSKKLLNDPNLIADWEEFSTLVKSFSAQLDHLKNSFLFSFVEGTLVKAITRGEWILLDEVNLASPETLESLSGILQSPTGSLLLLERGDTEPVKRHPDFRLFACMNPANDAGKRDLPPGLLSRFTEMWVDSPDTIPQDLALIIRRHLYSCLPPPTQGGNAIVADIAEFHTAVKNASESGFLVDGSSHKVNINLRTLTRALGFASSCASTYGLRRSLYEGCQMTYATILGKDSLEVISKLFEKHLMNGIKNMGSFLKSIPKMPGMVENGGSNSDAHILFGSYWIKKGPLEANEAPKYVLTKSVETNLNRLARAVMSSKYPVLIQGPTSAGKTSMVEYLATRTGHRFIRVNNHEHTDLQEYIGTYVSNAEGKLVFREGVLVEALRKGHWIVLDELNLAPSDVLESLNRLLDDNRELLIPETQETVRPHPGFMLFATQNPPGLYGGRKQLSRAFRSRFIELHFDDIPEPELSIILERRCRLPPSYSAKIVSTYKGLQNARQRSRIFEGKHAFATLRDLFRWGNRPADSAEELAENGFMVLAEKSRRDDEKEVVRDVLEQTFRLKLDPVVLYDREWTAFMSGIDVTNAFVKNVVWTNAMKRLFVLVLKSIKNLEPILLVGETGCGKTTVCQILTNLMGINLQIVNAHAGSETSDFIGSMRPVRGRERTVAEALEHIAGIWVDIAQISMSEKDASTAKNINALYSEYNGNLQTIVEILKARLNELEQQPENSTARMSHIDFLLLQSKKLFEWSDGPLVQAMRVGEAFLLDEISLADDSVLERLNSVLESERLLVLAERGAVSSDDTDGHDPTHSHIEEIRGHTNFSFMATMNPGGDYGKKELSPALRNRFTELWVPSIGDKTDLQMIINQRLNTLTFRAELIHQITDLLLDFLDWFAAKLNMARTSIVSLRDIMAWVAFITTMMKTEDTVGEDSLLLLCKSAFHGGCMVLLDGIGVNPLFGAMLGSSAAAAFRRECSHQLASSIHSKLLAGSLITLDAFFVEISYFLEKVEIVSTDDQFGIPPFLVHCGPEPRKEVKFALKAPTTSINALRVLRALRLSKPVLLEGSPGVGKSSLISALSATAGYSLCRINLSEQTDLMDLFGSDLPVEGGKGGEFAWRDGPFLSAMKTGQWVLLDELNLATQQVLEGLNACLDHRATVYIPELNRSFDCHANFRVFAAQNPQNQGGGRKGLPKSFVNRFTQVYIEALTSEDMLFIVANLHPEVDEDIVRRMIQFNQAMHEETMVKHSFGSRGSPWEFNLRDILRWIELLKSDGNASINYLSNPHQFLKMMYCQRMRTKSDEAAVLQLFSTFFADQVPKDCGFEISSNHLKVGSSLLMRTGRRQPHNRGYVTGDRLEILSSQLSVLESLIKCVEMSWMAILSGSTSSGKTSMVRLLAKLAGQQLDEFSMNSGIDAVELLGGFEQVDLTRREQSIIRDLEHTVDCILRYYTLYQDTEFESSNAFHLLSAIRKLGQTTDMMMETVLGLICDMDGALNASGSGSGLKDYIIQAGAKLPIDIRTAFEELQSLISSGVHGQFEWIDGTLIKALEEGRWILIDNANMCPASVLDRLNHLLEPNGVLIINERGLVNGEIKVIKPHPNFRMFMTVDPQVGEISRAMRNRGVELFLHSKLSQDEGDIQSSIGILDMASLLNSHGLPGVDIPKRLQKISSDFGRHIRGLHIPFDDSPSMLVKFAKIAVERVERGFYWHESAIEAWNETYFDTASLSSLPETSSATLLASFSELTAYTEVATARFPVRPFPSSWPFRVSGKLCIQESMLSHVAMESSFLVFLSSLEGEIVHLESSDTLQESDLKLLSPLPKNISLLRSAIFSFVEKDTIIPSIKNMVLAYIARRYSVMQSSFALETGLKLIDSKISNIFDILHAVEYMIRQLGSEALDLMALVFSFQAVIQHMKNASEVALELSKPTYDVTEKLAEAIDGCYATLDVRSFECLSSLWKSSSVVTLRSESLINLELELISVGKRLGLEGKSVLGNDNTLIFMFKTKRTRADIVSQCLMDVDPKIKHSMLEAGSTLYYLNESQSDETIGMLDVISKIPTEINAHLDKLDGENQAFKGSFDLENRLQQPLSSLEVLGIRGTRFGVTPITDIKSLRTQKVIIAKLSELAFDTAILSKKPELKALAAEIQICINFEINETLNSAQSLLPLQRIVWLLNSNFEETYDDAKILSMVRNILFEAFYRWHQRAWQNSCTLLLSSEAAQRDFMICHGNVHEEPKVPIKFTSNDKVIGPDLLFRSISTKIGMSLLGTLDQVPIYSFQSKTVQIQKLSRNFQESVPQTFVSDSLRGDLNIIFLLLNQILDGHQECFSSEDFVTVKYEVETLRKQLQVRGASSNSANTLALRGLLQVVPEKSKKHLITLLEGLSEGSAAGFGERSLGRSWIGVSMAFLRSYLPSTAIDPALSAETQLDMLRAIKEAVQSDILTALELEHISKSLAQTDFSDKLATIASIDASEESIKSKMVFRPAQSQIAAIVNDLNHLGNNVLRDEIISLCLNPLSDPKQILFLQESLKSFIERMEAKYPLYRDILQPVFLSVYQLRLGLVLISSNSSTDGSTENLNTLLEHLLDFVAVIDSEKMDGSAFSSHVSSVTSKDIEIPTLVSVIRRFCWFINHQQTISYGDMGVIHSWFNELSTKWIEAEADASRMEREKDELYKYKERNHEVLNEEQIAEADLLEIFPDFYDEFEEEHDDSKPDEPGGVQKLRVPIVESKDEKPALHLDDSVAFEMRELHERLFSDVEEGPSADHGKSYQIAYLKSFECSSRICGEMLYPLAFSFEDSTQAGKIVVADMRLDSLAAAPEDAPVSETFDFYRDHNIAEAQRLQSILHSLDVMVSQLIDEWPENSILLHLRVLHNRIASFPITSPIMKLLTGVEILFQKCHEWETYASSKVSLKDHLEVLTNLIVRWRKIELRSWKNLLRVEDRMAETKSSKLWFHLFRSLIGPALVHASSDQIEAEVAESDLVSTLDQLLLSSTLGEFRGRLKLLLAFHRHLQAIRKEAAFTSAIDSMLNVLWNVHQYYSQFIEFVNSHVDNLRKPIVKELDGYVRIATWKDVNVFALKESSKRSHYHLHKFVKKYREILSLPIKDVITSYHQEIVLDGGAVTAKGKPQASLYVPSESSLVTANASVSTTAAIRDLSSKDCEKLSTRMRTLSKDMVIDNKRADILEGLEDLATTVIDRIQFYQRPPEAGAAVKGQRMIRKKALVDLLKYLEYLGLSPNTSARFNNQQKPAFLYTQKKLSVVESLSKPLEGQGFDDKMNQTSAAVWKKADVYYFKLLSRISSAREAALSFNRDLSDREMSKSMSFLEDLLHVIIGQRRDLAGAVAAINPALIQGIKRCAAYATSGKRNEGPLKADMLKTTELIFSHAKAVSEVDACLTQSLVVLDCLAKSDESMKLAAASIKSAQFKLSPARSLIRKISETYAVKSSGKLVPFIAHQEIILAFEVVQMELRSVLSSLESVINTHPSIVWLWRKFTPRLSLLCAELQSSFECFQSERMLSQTPGQLETVSLLCDSLVDTILVAFQDLRQQPADSTQSTSLTSEGMEDEEADQFGLQKGALFNSNSRYHLIFSETRLNAVNSMLSRIIRTTESLPSDHDVETASKLLGRVYPLLEQYLLMYQYSLYEFIGFHKATTKLAYILSNSFCILFKKGFCIPKEDDDSDEQDQQEEHGSGLGIGEGEGSKDVSDEIEDESQVEGMKNDANEAPKPEKKMKEEKDGVEMEGDFDGVLEDVSDDGEGEEGDEKEEKELDEEQMGDLDRDLADVVDEKLWDGDDKQDQDAKTEKDSQSKSQPGDEELVAKDDDSSAKQEPQPQDKNDGKSDEPKDGESEEGDDEHEDEMPEDQINDLDDQYEDNTGVKPKSSIDDDDSQQKGEDEEDGMDLPEDLNLDDDAGGDGFEDMNMDSKDDRPDSPMAEDNQTSEEMDEDQPFPEDDPDTQMERLDENADDQDMAEQEDVDPPAAADEALPETTEKENPEMLSAEPDENEKEEEAEVQQQSNARDRNLGNSDTQKTKDNIVNAAAENDNDQKEDSADDPNATADSGRDSQRKDGGKNDVANERESDEATEENKQQKNSESDFNPHRSLGDATKKWINRFKNLFDKDPTTDEPIKPDAVEKDQQESQDSSAEEFEFVENDDSEFDNQVLHAANSEQMSKMDQKALAEENGDDMDEAMEVDKEEQDSDQAPEKNSSEFDKPDETEDKGTVKGMPKLGKVSDDKQDDENQSEADDQENLKADSADSMDENTTLNGRQVQADPKDDDSEEDYELEPLTDEAIRDLRQQLQDSTEKWRKSGQDLTEARTLWRQYSTLTRELSFSLCESLRLILEPTLATKLKGDYRAGKRLNMRKVIAYIASQFKKDKIWLRRTRPSKRTYQIMISIDDSRSMAESKSIELAFESLSLISKALTQLEVGEISVVSFGEEVRLLHPFEKPFSDEAGAEVIHDFTFSQDGTQVRKMMEATTEIFKTARQSSQGSAELWQLQIVISDGILEDHAAVRALVRQAAQARIMVVFVVLDKRGDRDSILRMTNVSYTAEGLKMTRYMDTFPFDFYVVLNRIEDLPEVLSDTLRQYFMFVNL
ncbi:AAA ATPase midasin [Chytriomyces hyalinus]|nr:AAA ATPase midasin [Chytriomyces hyalinus]